MQTEKAQETEMVLVLGGTSKTGSRVAERLEAREAAAICVWGDGRCAASSTPRCSRSMSR